MRFGFAISVVRLYPINLYFKNRFSRLRAFVISSLFAVTKIYSTYIPLQTKFWIKIDLLNVTWLCDVKKKVNSKLDLTRFWLQDRSMLMYISLMKLFHYICILFKTDVYVYLLHYSNHEPKRKTKFIWSHCLLILYFIYICGFWIFFSYLEIKIAHVTILRPQPAYKTRHSSHSAFQMKAPS